MAGEKRSQDTEEEPQRTENIIIVDIEGTTTSISFVKETLFPYVREHLKEYIEKNWENAEFKEDLEKLKEQAKKDESDKVEGVIPITSATTDEEKETVLKNIQWQMDNDRKSTALKQLQGHMWREAYKSGGVKGHVYDDVPKALEEWTTSGKKVYVYSSGSVEAQKLLFGHSTHGDLLKHFTDYFDTEIGGKQEASSYKAIASKIEADASKILFLTDIPNEAKAAVEAGFSSVLVVREGNEPLSTEEKSKYSSIKSFLDLSFQSAAKRQKLEEPKEAPAKKEDEKKEEKPEKKAEEPEDVEMKDVSDKKPEKPEEKKDSEKLKAPEDNKEPPKEAAEPEKSPEKSPTIEKEPEEPKKPAEEPEKMEIEKEIKKNDEKDDKSDDKLPEIKEIKETKTDDATKKDDKINKTDEIKEENEKMKEIVDEKKSVDEKKVEESKKVDDKIEKIEKIEEKKEEKAEEKENGGDEVKQNGDKTSETIEEKKIVKELNGESKKKEEDVKEEEKKEAKEIVEEEKKEKNEKKEKEEEKKAEESEKKVNGNTDNEEKHRISEDTTKTTTATTTTTTTTATTETSNKNGESSVVDDNESIKIKKVVDSIVDGAGGDTDVVTPVAVVAATS